MKLRILLADDHTILREGLVLLIEEEPDMAVVGQASDGDEALRMACELKPDVAVIDLSMPGLGGAEVTEQIHSRCAPTRVLALTRHTDPGYVRRLLQAGASGYVVKKSAAATLIAAIRSVAQGGTYIEPALAGALLQHTFGQPTQRGRPRMELSAREEEVLRGIAWGRSN